MKQYFRVFIKDSLVGNFWTYDVVANKRLDALEFVAAKSCGGSVIGVQECKTSRALGSFTNGKIREGMFGF